MNASLDTLKDLLPEYAKDLRLNLDQIEKSASLTPAQAWSVALASALATREPRTIALIEEGAAAHLDDAGRRGARAAAAVMAMNNVYYRFLHLCSNPVYGTMPARLRMQVIANPGVPKVDFELASLAVSAIHGCGRCIDAHEQTLRQAGATPEAIQDTVRLAAVVHAAGATLSTLAPPV